MTCKECAKLKKLCSKCSAPSFNEDAEMERQQLAAGWEGSSYGYDDAYGGDGDVYLPNDDFYDEDEDEDDTVWRNSAQ